MTFLSKWEPYTFAALRIVAGFMYSCHGAQKLFGVLGGQSQLHNPLFLAAGIIEFVGGILILVGFQTSCAAFIASGEMASAYFMVHARGGFFPIVNKGELAVLYCFLFLFISAHGAGRFAIDRERRVGFMAK